MASILLAASLTLVPSAVASAQGVPPPAYEYQKVPIDTFSDASGATVILRRGYYVADQGFGWDKIVGKHKITNKNLVQKIIKDPRGGESQGTSRAYRGFAQRFRCDMSNRCTEVERIPLKAVVDFRIDPNLGDQRGVITAFCDFGVTSKSDCPSWVNNVENVAR